MNFADRLVEAIQAKGTPVVVGLDPRLDQLPGELVDRHLKRHGLNTRGVAAALEEFCQCVLDVVAPLVPAVKLQIAFFERFGPPGMEAFYNVSIVARRKGLLVIGDAKLSDIGSTAEAYSDGWLRGVKIGADLRHIWDVDALTVNPFLGSDGVAPSRGPPPIPARACSCWCARRTRPPVSCRTCAPTAGPCICTWPSTCADGASR